MQDDRTDDRALARVAARYAVAITPALDALIAAEGADGPVARQFRPDARELIDTHDDRPDPIGDAAHSPVPGIVHRHRDRVLLAPLLACPAYCRFCFRRETVGQAGAKLALTAAELDAAIGYIADHDEIWEVILTGGDPLALSTRRLGDIVRRLDAIAHVEVIRIHTRVPVVDPQRITAALVRALAAAKPVYVAVHCNHATELTEPARAACARLADAGHPLLAQTVLLRGVNDDPATLEALMRALVRNRIKPYYLHHADLAPGTGHFRTTIVEGQRLVAELRARASGLCQPSYVLDIPGGYGKVPIGPSYHGDGYVTDPAGRTHRYP
jgi:lysine 2,3-aminomutase